MNRSFFWPFRTSRNYCSDPSRSLIHLYNYFGLSYFLSYPSILILRQYPRRRFSSEKKRENNINGDEGKQKVDLDFRQRIKFGPSLKDFITASDVDPDGLPGQMAPVSQKQNYRVRLPHWLKTEIPQGGNVAKLTRELRSLKLHTVCEEARCPNVNECWGGHSGVATATIMIMGDTCTRGCRFCSVKTSSHPSALDPDEPSNTAQAISQWNVDYIVITSVNRDDLSDFGARHIAETIRQIKARKPSIMIECLVPDFQGDLNCVGTILNAKPEVYAHNIETVEPLQRAVRDHRANYVQSLRTLEAAKERICHQTRSSGDSSLVVTKSSIMLGLGETDEEVNTALRDLRQAGVDCVTLGQYIQPTKRHLKVKEYIHPDKFDYWAKVGEAMGFLYTASGPLVRSSYRAGEYYVKHIVEQRKQGQI